MKNLILKSIFAGIAIAIGAIVYVLTKETSIILGAAMFSVGMLLVKEFDLNLFTSYVPQNVSFNSTHKYYKKTGTYLKNCFIVLFFNFVGAAMVAIVILNTRISDEVVFGSISKTFREAVEHIAHHKVDDGLLSVFFMSLLCGIVIAGISRATKYKSNVAYVVIFIATFIIAGFDHIVANSFYLVYSGELFSIDGLIYFAINIIGNLAGGVLFGFVPLIQQSDAKGEVDKTHYY